MPLSEEEQRLLDEMERNLYGVKTDVHAPSERGGRVSRRGIVLGLVGIALGVIGLVVGVTTGAFIWGVLGFAFMIAGAMAAISLREGASARPRKMRAPRASASTKESFMQRLDERWDRRD